MHLSRFASLLLVVGAWAVGAPAARPELPPLVPRQVLFRDAELGAPILSPDGTLLAWIAPTNGLPNLWVRPVATNSVRLISRDPRGSVRQLAWQADSTAVLYLQDSDGLGNWHVMQVHVPSGNIRDLTPFAGVRARLIAVSPHVPAEILVTLNLRDRRIADLFRLNLYTGAVLLEAENSGEISTWYADADLNPRVAQVVLPGGELALSTRADERSVWRPLLRWGGEDALGRVFGFGPGGTNLWLVSSVQAPAPRLLSVDLNTGAAGIVAQDPRFDVSSALLHPVSNTLEAVQFARSRAQWQVLNRERMADFEALRRFRGGDVDILSRDDADRLWTVAFTDADAPLQYALYDRPEGRVVPLFSERPALDGVRFAAVRPIAFKARDGLPLEGYLTLPAGLDPKNLPTIVLVHGGPWARTIWGFDLEAQWLANRGYAVLQVNYRGSTGYGKDHVNAGDKEWGGKILSDLVDAKKWAVDQGHADSRRTALMGTGFGGYAVLAALAMQPDEFAAGISISGAPNLLTMVSAVASNAPALRPVFDRRVGRLDADAALLRAQSPASRVAFLKAPVLIGGSAGDPQAPVAELDAFVAAIRREGRSPEYLLFREEDGALRNPVNRLRLYAAVEAFLARHLGGRAEPPAEFEQFEKMRR